MYRVTSFSVAASLLLAACGSGAGEGIVIQGSDTEVQLVSTLVEAFAEIHPDANISVAGGGSAVGIAALINGETDIANSSRPLNEKERAAAKGNGVQVQEFLLARDGLSIIVHPSNPLARISMQQLSDVFSGRVTNWKELGGPDAPIVLYGRQSTSGTFGFFRDTVVKGDYADTMRQMEGTQAIVDAVKSDTNAIGYAGIGYVKVDGAVRDDVKVVSVSADATGTAYSPLDRTAVENQTYPIARRIYQYLPAVPAKDSLLERFLRFEASDEGQAIVESAGFYSLIGVDETQNASFFDAVK